MVQTGAGKDSPASLNPCTCSQKSQGRGYMATCPRKGAAWLPGQDNGRGEVGQATEIKARMLESELSKVNSVSCCKYAWPGAPRTSRERVTDQNGRARRVR